MIGETEDEILRTFNDGSDRVHSKYAFRSPFIQQKNYGVI